MVEINFTVELGLPVERSTIRLGFLCDVQCVAQSESPNADLDVYVLLFEGMGDDRREHKIYIKPIGHKQAHRILDAMAQAIWDEANGAHVTEEIRLAWDEIESEERAELRRRGIRHAEGSNAWEGM